MKTLQIIVIILILLQSCNSGYKKIDIKAASQLVHLDSIDLSVFSQLKEELLNDSSAIRKQNDETKGSFNRTSWLTTNSYYLNQIDSLKYSAFFYKLKDKLVNLILVNRDGSAIFTIKQNTQMNDNNYNDTYSHQLVSGDCNCPIAEVFNQVDTVFVDSVINKKWRYTFLKVLTGH